MNQKELIKRPLFHNFVKYNGNIWFWDVVHNGLFSCDNDGNSRRIPLKCYQTYDLCKETLYNKIILFDDKLIGVPCVANEVLIYHLKRKEEEYISLSSISFNESAMRRGKFWDAVCYGKVLLLIGFWTSWVVKLNVETREVIESVDLYQYFDKNEIIDNVYFKNACVYNDKLLIPACLNPIVFEVDIGTMEYSIHRFENMENGFSYIYADGDRLWLSPRRTDAIICWDRTTDERHYYSQYPDEFAFGNASIGFIEKCNDNIFFIPLGASGILMLNEKEGQIKLAVTLNSKMEEQFALGEQLKINKCWNVSKRDDCLVILNGVDRKLYFYNIVDESIFVKDVIVSKEECIIYKGSRMEKANTRNDFFMEGEYDIDDFCAYLVFKDL